MLSPIQTIPRFYSERISISLTLSTQLKIKFSSFLVLNTTTRKQFLKIKGKHSFYYWSKLSHFTLNQIFIFISYPSFNTVRTNDATLAPPWPLTPHDIHSLKNRTFPYFFQQTQQQIRIIILKKYFC